MKRIVTIQDFSCVGSCSLTAAIPVLSAAGVECCGIPTALLSNHTGFPTFYSIDLTDELKPISSQLEREHIGFDGIYTGYIASVEQIELIQEFIRQFRKPGDLLLIDPVMGDNGKMYAALTNDYPERMRSLIAGADIITPNITEACLLTGRSFDPCPTLHETKEMLTELCGMGVHFAVITGFSERGQLGAVGCYDGRFTEFLTPKRDVACSGTGDVFASALMGAVLRGADYPQALEIATRFTFAAVDCTASAPDRRFYGIHFQQVLGQYIEMLNAAEAGRSDA
ncbi:MAG: pyridoxamine kinase [Oscillospiraceae bacterium]